MNIQQIEMVIVFVTDVDESVRWYQRVLEMTLLSRHGDFATLQAGSSRIGLHGGADGKQDLRNAGSMPVFSVESYQAAKDTLLARGCEFIFENSTPAARFGTFLDPDGNPLQLMAQSGAGQN